MKPFKLIARRQKEKEHDQRRADAVKTLLMNDCVAVYQKYGIKKAVLFGSLMTGSFSGTSDVDIYVEPLENKEYYEFMHALEHILNFNVDLHTNKDEASLVRKILERGQAIFEDGF